MKTRTQHNFNLHKYHTVQDLTHYKQHDTQRDDLLGRLISILYIQLVNSIFINPKPQFFFKIDCYITRNPTRSYYINY